MSPAPALTETVAPASKRPRPASRILRAALAGGVLAIALWVVWREVRGISPELMRSALAGIPPWTLVAAFILTAASYACLAATEAIVVRAMGLNASRGRAMLTSAAAFAASNSLGFSFASQAAVRLRGYGPAGLSHGQIVRLTLIVSMAVSLSGVVTAGLVMGATPLVFSHALHRPAGAVALLALALAAPAALWFLAFRRSGPAWLGGGTSRPPPPRDRCLALAVGLGDWLASGAALFVLLPDPTVTGFAVFLVVFVIGSLVSAASGVPGGIGVFEAIVIALSPLVAQTHETAAALLVYRLIYSLGPASLTALAFVSSKALRRLRS